MQALRASAVLDEAQGCSSAWPASWGCRPNRCKWAFPQRGAESQLRKLYRNAQSPDCFPLQIEVPEEWARQLVRVQTATSRWLTGSHHGRRSLQPCNRPYPGAVVSTFQKLTSDSQLSGASLLPFALLDQPPGLLQSAISQTNDCFHRIQRPSVLQRPGKVYFQKGKGQSLVYTGKLPFINGNLKMIQRLTFGP